MFHRALVHHHHSLKNLTRFPISTIKLRKDEDAPPPRLPDIDSTMMTRIITQNPKPIPKTPEQLGQLGFGEMFTDHMLEIDWDNDKGWGDPIIRPLDDFHLSPASTALQYGLQAFDGFKAYRSTIHANEILLFRPQLNVRRLLSSCEALFFPTFDPDQFMECLFELLDVERDWVPRQEGYALYVRPTVISTHPFIDPELAASLSVKLYVLLSPVGPYFSSSSSTSVPQKSVKVVADSSYIRAHAKAPIGSNPIGGNYGPTIRYRAEAERECDAQQIMFLRERTEDHNSRNKDDLLVNQLGDMNQFFVWKKKGQENDVIEIVTPPLDGTIVPGVTRDSILTLCRQKGSPYQVVERNVSMREVVAASEEGRLLESFGTGTEAVVCPVREILFEGKRLVMPRDEEAGESYDGGKLANELLNEMMDIQYGRVPHKWSVRCGDALDWTV